MRGGGEGANLAVCGRDRRISTCIQTGVLATHTFGLGRALDFLDAEPTPFDGLTNSSKLRVHTWLLSSLSASHARSTAGCIS